MTNSQTQHPKQYRTTFIVRVIGVLILLAGLLFADLYFRGLAWQYFWSQTGEESIFGQLQGMVELGGNVIRPNPNLAIQTPIEHTDIFPYGINTFFEQEPDVNKMRVQFQMISDAGFGWIRQEFPWEDIEIDGNDQFTDTRIDRTGDGIIDSDDTISAWDKYDQIVDLADEYSLDMIVRLSNPPNWARAGAPEVVGSLAPPDDYQDFVDYAVAVADRYQGRIQYYQVWNEPNIYPEWGENFASPADYTRLLCMTYDALKEVDPDIVVIAGTIAPTTSIDGYFGYHDLLFIQGMYDNGAADCFDVFSAQGYGLNSGPTDRRQRATYLSYARHVLYRDLMVANDDAQTPIWLSEVAWNPMDEPCFVGGECVSPDEIAGAYNFGAVTNDQAARYLPLAYERAQEEWHWIGHISYWHFTRPTIEEADQAFYWFRMVEADYSEEDPTFSPLPIYYSAQDYLTNIRETVAVYRGIHQAESWEFTASEDSEVVSDSNAEFGEALQTSSLAFRANGSDISIRVNNDSPIVVIQDGSVLTTIDASVGWQTVTIASETLAREADYALEGTNSTFLIDSVQVRTLFWLRMMPLLCGIGAVVGAGVVLSYPFLMRRLRENRR